MTDDFKAAANRNARDEKKETYLRSIYDRYTEQFRAAGDQDASSVARSVHIAMDEVLQRDRQKSAGSENIRCGKGAVWGRSLASFSANNLRPRLHTNPCTGVDFFSNLQQ